ncbi:FtsX-like permease family protein [Oceanobacillus neutriphilus]|uniref:ABC3 transporter permease C-terminal domain-containing protein n=1 Tax=Oceanobacillus neutriphilus TaxID=531815 RepID=A0ABQ2NRK3_9BACI|nr:FtsX-like permease family protein [Oceanobacillus neutriphilus]GGP08514.1 hypothetical protein GCM10011346_08860 [Oceanobacillus neutriphilus]
MIKWIINYWRRNKGKFALLVIGAILISSGLSFLIGLSETSKGTIVNALEKKWNASYDIVVRPNGSKSETEKDGLIDPNYLSGLQGGISFEDLDKIKEIDDVEIAAPISVIGFTSIEIVFAEMKFPERGIYKITVNYVENDGIQNYSNGYIAYYGIDIGLNPENMERLSHYGLSVNLEKNVELYGTFNFLVAGIDPSEEAKLIRLNKAMLSNEGNRYFSDSDKVQSITETSEGDEELEELGIDFNYQRVTAPVIMSNVSSINNYQEATLEKLDIGTDLESAEDIKEFLAELEQNGKEGYLDTFETEPMETVKATSEMLHENLLEQSSLGAYRDLILYEKASPLTYETVPSPFPERWDIAYKIISPGDQIVNIDGEKTGDISDYTYYTKYRELSFYDEPALSRAPRLTPEFLGYYDPRQLSISSDPVTELPMETYRTPTAKHMLDAYGSPVNPPEQVTATSNPFGYLMQSPTMLTNMEAAREIVGEEAISAIRIKVAGVKSPGPESQSKLEAIAQEITNETGLEADITLGSSPQPVLIQIPSVDDLDSLGWVEQPWIKTGESIAIYDEAVLGYSGIIICLMAVAIMYVFTTNFISYLSRKKEFAVLKALGWKNSKLRHLLLAESMLIGGFVSFITLIVLIILQQQNPGALSFWRIGLIISFILLIYFTGALYPSYLVNRISPYEVMKQGEISERGARLGRTRGVVSLVRNNLMSRWRRHFVSVLTIALPTALLILFLFVSFQLDGVMYTSWLGEYVALEIGPIHYYAVILSLVIAVMTTAELIWQNVLERTKEIALFKALGWGNQRIYMMVLLEGALLGFLAGIIGIFLSLGILSILYGNSLSIEQWLWLVLINVSIPVIVGLVSAVFPAIRAVKVEPYRGLQ